MALCDVCFVDIVMLKIIICFNSDCKKIICKKCILNSIHNNIYNFKCYHCDLKINNKKIKKYLLKRNMQYI
ncbi:hypothetical protein MYSEV_255 [Mythimna separata entomopoxvirus 'L']|uniref:RING-type domain-containing protein n=1 Tax=Mythimna separata entomopoxvirus 'L' TaxID=1293572 RepID=A0A916NYM0_9POXV|nr:hypothetical protein MYSEV_255 [Mythimna separata entomopoxvirus 'L']CCU56453.1 hypothetical protein MYSEV_255 [Mythimna separata entomopoxvirus 'L']